MTELKLVVLRAGVATAGPPHVPGTCPVHESVFALVVLCAGVATAALQRVPGIFQVH
jgi:hypothetical protein